RGMCSTSRYPPRNEFQALGGPLQGLREPVFYQDRGMSCWTEDESPSALVATRACFPQSMRPGWLMDCVAPTCTHLPGTAHPLFRRGLVLHALGPLLVLPKVRTSGFSSTSHVRVTERTELLAIFGVKRLTPQVVGGTTRIIAAVNQKG